MDGFLRPQRGHAAAGTAAETIPVLTLCIVR